MTWAHGPVVTRRRLGGELKRLREQSGKKLEDVAKVLECSPSKVSRLENGKGLPRTRDVRDMLDVYAVPDGETRERLLEWSRTGRQPTWWRAYADVLQPGFDTYVELEWDASRICAYESHVVHGLLQTSDYARDLIKMIAGVQDGPHLDRMLEVRTKRQEVLGVEHGLQLRCVLDESVLHRRVSTPSVMRKQVGRLIEIAEADHVDIRILPFSAGAVGAFMESFAKLEFSETLERGLVYIERRDTTTTFLDERSDIAVYEARMAALLGASLTEEQSVPLLKKAFAEMAS